MREMTVLRENDTGKGRRFSASLLAAVHAPKLVGEAGSGKRPVFAAFGGSEDELRPFLANARAGKRLGFADRGYYRRGGDFIEFQRSLAYEQAWQREPEGSIATLFLPDLFAADPGMVDPERVEFCCMPPARWLAAQSADLAAVARDGLALAAVENLRRRNYPEVDEVVRRLAPIATAFAVYLDRRTRAPIYADSRLYMRLLVAMLGAGLASLPSNSPGRVWANWGWFEVEGVEDLGYASPVLVMASQQDVEALVVEETVAFLEEIDAATSEVA